MKDSGLLSALVTETEAEDPIPSVSDSKTNLRGSLWETHQAKPVDLKHCAIILELV